MAVDRIRQVNELLFRAISAIIREELELPLGAFVTITEVKTARDLKSAVLFITILPNSQRGSIFEFLQKKTHFMQHALTKRIKLQWIPRLTFELDDGAIKAQRIYELLDKKDPQE